MTRSLLSVVILLSGTALASAAALPGVDDAPTLPKTASVSVPEASVGGVKPLADAIAMATSARETGSALLPVLGADLTLTGEAKK